MLSLSRGVACRILRLPAVRCELPTRVRAIVDDPSVERRRLGSHARLRWVGECGSNCTSKIWRAFPEHRSAQQDAANALAQIGGFVLGPFIIAEGPGCGCGGCGG